MTAVRGMDALGRVGSLVVKTRNPVCGPRAPETAPKTVTVMLPLVPGEMLRSDGPTSENTGSLVTVRAMPVTWQTPRPALASVTVRPASPAAMVPKLTLRGETLRLQPVAPPLEPPPEVAPVEIPEVDVSPAADVPPEVPPVEAPAVVPRSRRVFPCSSRRRSSRPPRWRRSSSRPQPGGTPPEGHDASLRKFAISTET